MLPSVGVRVTVPVIGVVPFRNCTVPLGATPLLCVFTMAVSVTLVPAPPWTIVEGLAVTATVVAAFVTVKFRVTGWACL